MTGALGSPAIETDGPEPISAVLNHVHYGLGFQNDRMARMARVDPSTMSRARNDEHDLRSSNLQALSWALCRYDLPVIPAALMPSGPGGFGVCRIDGTPADGNIQQEVGDLAEGTGMLRAAHRAQDPEQMALAIATLERALDRARAELHQIRTRT